MENLLVLLVTALLGGVIGGAIALLIYLHFEATDKSVPPAEHENTDTKTNEK